MKNALADYVDLLFQTSDFYDWAFYYLHFMSFIVFKIF